MDFRLKPKQSPPKQPPSHPVSTATAVPEPKPKSRRSRTRWAFQIEEQERRWKQKEQSLLHQVDREIEAAYGFVSDYNLSVSYRASLALATMPTWLYHIRPTRMAFHDLTTRMKPPKNLRCLLGLNLKFVPNPPRNVPWSTF
jgi:hypothetical protein